MSEAGPKVVPFATVRANVPAALRKLADDIEANKWGQVRFCGAVIVVGADEVAAFAYGAGTDMEFNGAFVRASMLSCSCLRDLDVEDDGGGVFTADAARSDDEPA